MAAVDYFLKIDGIDGESHDAKHKGEIDVLSFSLSAAQEGTGSTGGGSGAGKVRFNDLHIIKILDKSSPKLMLACASGQHIPTAFLYLRKAGGEQQEFSKVKLSDVFVSSYQSGGYDGGTEADSFDKVKIHIENPVAPVEYLSLNFAKIEFEYKEQQKDGTMGGAVSGGWDLKANKKL